MCNMRMNTPVQLSRLSLFERLAAVTDPFDISLGQEKPERFTVDVQKSAARFFEQLALFQNALAAERGKTLRRKLSRKALVEEAVRLQALAYRKQMKDMLEAVGDFPALSDDPDPETRDRKNEEAARAYAKRVLKWDASRSSK